MDSSGLRKFYWGFLFIMLNFRIQGVDILPDVVGYLLFAVGFNKLSLRSDYFIKAAKYNVPMIILSILSIYQRPNQGDSINFGGIGILSIIIAIIHFVLNLVVIYNLFMGIKDLMIQKGQVELEEECDERWNQYKMLQIAFLAVYILILVPILAILYIIVMFVFVIGLMIKIMRFIKICDEEINI